MTQAMKTCSVNLNYKPDRERIKEILFRIMNNARDSEDFLNSVASYIFDLQTLIGDYQDAYIEYLNTHAMPSIADVRARRQEP